MALLAHLAVRSTKRLSTSFVRVELAGPHLAEFGVDGPTLDVRIKLIFPAADTGLPALREESWWPDFQALPEDKRGHLRTYTIREVRGWGAEISIVVDFVLHPGAHGPGSSWAGSARSGDEILAVLPRRGTDWGGIEWAPGAADDLLLVGDETAVPAICSILESLPPDARGRAFLEVPTSDDTLHVAAPPGVEIRWLPRDGAPVGSLATLALVGGTTLDEGAGDDVVWETPTFSGSGEAVTSRNTAPGVDRTYAWIAGESAMVRTLRRHLVTEAGMRRDQVSFMGYWREGVAMRG